MEHIKGDLNMFKFLKQLFCKHRFQKAYLVAHYLENPKCEKCSYEVAR